MIFTVFTSEDEEEKEEKRPDYTDRYKGEKAVIGGGPTIDRLFEFRPKDVFSEAFFALIRDVNGLQLQATEDCTTTVF